MNLIEPNKNVSHKVDVTQSTDGNDIKGEACNKLCDIVANGLDIHRCIAAKALGRMHADEAVQTLIAALLDEDEDVRADAADALARIGDPASEKQLLENLIGDPSRDVKLSAIEALANLGSQEVVPWLQRMVTGRDDEIVWDDADYFAGGWDDWTDIQIKAIEALAALGNHDSVSAIVDAIRDEEGQDLDQVGFTALARLGGDGLKELAGFMKDPSERRRRRAAGVLIADSGPVGDAAFMQALEDKSPAVRLAAGEALAKRNPDDERMLFVLLDQSAMVRAAAVPLSARYHPDRILRLIQDPDTKVRIAAMALLISDPDLIADNEDKETIVDEIKTCLKIEGTSLAAIATEALAAVAPDTAEQLLLPIIADDTCQSEVRLGAARALARLGGDEAAKALARVLSDENRQLRMEALSGLSAMTATLEGWPNAYGDLLVAAMQGILVSNPEPEPEEEQEQTHDEASDDDNANAGDEAGEEAESEVAPEVSLEPESKPDSDTEIEAAKPQDEPESEPEPEPAPAPTSTLDAILADNGENQAIAEADETPVELDSQDLEFLSLAEDGKMSKKRVSPTPDIPAHSDVRVLAARLLGDHCNDIVAMELIDALNAEDEALNVAGVDSLYRIAAFQGTLPEQVIASLIDVLGKRQVDLRMLAIRALGLSGAENNEAEKALIKLLKNDDSYLRSEAVSALGRLGLAWPAIVKRMSDEDPSVRLVAAEAMAARNLVDDMDQLGAFALSYSGYHGREAARMMRALDPDGANKYFLSVLGDEELKHYWSISIEALETINAKHAA